MQIIVPKRFVVPTYPLFYVAGPIRGGDDWQSRMCQMLKRHMPRNHGTVACPCRWGKSPEHPLAGKFARGNEERFPHQLDWERYYMERAALIGFEPNCLIFWLPLESKTSPRNKEDGPYAQDTYGELGEWRGRMMDVRAHVVIGAEAGFHGLSQIQRNFTAALGYSFPIYPTMEETVQAAVKRAYEL